MKFKFFLLALVLVLSLQGCSTSSSTGENEQHNTTATEGTGESLEIRLATGTTTGDYYIAGAAFTKLWNDNIPDVRVSPQATDATIQNLNMMMEGEANMAMVSLVGLYEAYHGTGKFMDREFKDVRVVSQLWPSASQIVVRSDIGANSIPDLKGEKVVVGAPGSSTADLSEQIFEAYDLTLEDFDAQFVGFPDATDLLRNRQIAGALYLTGIGNAVIADATSSADGQLINLDEEQAKQLEEKYPWLHKFSLPANMYEGQEQDIETVATSNLLVVPESMPEDIVYELTKVMWENIEKLKESTAITNPMELENATKNLNDIPLHLGAEKYYKEKGVLE